ncbi:cell polarity determinant GTPase MglA [Reticulibacter mediterranei]|uniref:Cell polarity determinant GTPase MglA n=1 Tax=Reticulibacter mediterranei TaxID=2778369 RepID=A0A8J3IYF4_9CHLR|nr:ADP-ribosylation factor-like protein [Reticulibacter mediterranei]GHP00235.1 cell polarity determinant GTPase MglA [Reticulibacter mediterranei]
MIHIAKREITCRILYYGIFGCGRMSNLRYLHHAINPRAVGERTPLDKETEPAYIDWVEFDLGKVHDFTLRFQFYQMVGPLIFDLKNQIPLLKRTDGVIFVADSQASKLQENIVCWNDLQELLRAAEKEPADVVDVMQWNKRDLPDVLPVSALEEALNPYQVPGYEAVAVTGKGVIECARVSINTTLRRLFLEKKDDSES